MLATEMDGSQLIAPTPQAPLLATYLLALALDREARRKHEDALYSEFVEEMIPRYGELFARIWYLVKAVKIVRAERKKSAYGFLKLLGLLGIAAWWTRRWWLWLL